MTVVSWILSSLSTLGAVLNALGMISGFYVWIVANLAWIGYDVYTGFYSQTMMFAVFTATSVLGIIAWRRKACLK